MKTEKMYKIIMISPGGTKHDFHGGFETELLAVEYARNNNYEFVDENGFVWNLEVVEEDVETADLIIPNKTWCRNFLEFRQHSDLDALSYLANIMEDTFNHDQRLKYIAIRRLVDSLLNLNFVIFLMEQDEIPVNTVIEEAYCNMIAELTKIAEESQNIG